MRLAFRLTKFNRYSFVPLFGAVGKFGHIAVCEGLEHLLSLKPSVVFYSFMSPHAEEVFREVKYLRSQLPDVLLIAGGPHPSAMPQQVLGRGFDAVVVGEGEGPCVDLLEDLLSGRVKPIYRSAIDGFPDYTMDDAPYTAAVELVRGCPFGCKFCQTSFLFGRKPRYRPVVSVIREASVLVARGRRFIRFIAPNALSYMSSDGVTPNISALEDLFVRLRDVGIEQIYFGSFPSELRPESVTSEAAELMARFCANRKVVVGAQSGSDGVLCRMGRGHTVADVEKAVSILNSFGFEISLDFIFGSPGETDKELKETINFIETLFARYRVRVHAHTFMPLPGTAWAGMKPSLIPRWAKRVLHSWEREGLLDGNWAQQEYMGRRLCQMYV